MTAVLVQKQSPVQATATAVTSTFASTPAVGNLLVAFMRANGTKANVTPPAGWTLAVDKNQLNALVSIGIWYRVAGASEPTGVTFNYSSSVPLSLQISEYTGLIKSAPLDQVGSADAGAGTVTSASSGTTPATTQTDELVIAGIANDSGAASSNTWTNGFTELTAVGSRLAVATKIVSATGAYETTDTFGTLRHMVGAIATFKAIPKSDGAWGTVLQ